MTSISPATELPTGAAQQTIPPVNLAQLKRVGRERIRKVYRFRSRSTRATGEEVDLGQVLDGLMEVLVRNDTLYFRDIHRELNSRFPGPEANKKRLVRWLPVLVETGILEKDPAGRYRLAIPVELSPAEIDAIYPRDVTRSTFRRIEAELAGVREELRRLNSMLTFFVNLASQRGQPGPKPEENREQPFAPVDSSKASDNGDTRPLPNSGPEKAFPGRGRCPGFPGTES